MQYWPIYRAVRRHLRRKLLSQHQPCIKMLMSLGAVYNGFKCDVRYSCILSLTYITWRMYWEGRQNIAGLSLDLPIAIDWVPPDIASKEASIGIFAHECLSSFWAFYGYVMLLLGEDGSFCIDTPNKADEGEMFLRNWAIDKGEHSERIFVRGRQPHPIAKLNRAELNTHLEKNKMSIQDISDRLLRRNVQVDM